MNFFLNILLTFEQSEFLSDVAAWIRRSVELLVAPAVDHLPFLLSPSRDPETIVVHLVMFHDHPVGEIEKYGMFKQEVLSEFVSFLFLVSNLFNHSLVSILL